MRALLLSFCLVVLVGCEKVPSLTTDGGDTAPTTSETQAASDTTLLEKENQRLRETLSHTANDAVLKERLDEIKAERQKLEQEIAAFNLAKQDFEKSHRDALIALENQNTVAAREAALAERSKELDKQHSGILLSVATLSILSLLVFYAASTSFVAPRIATKVVNELRTKPTDDQTL